MKVRYKISIAGLVIVSALAFLPWKALLVNGIESVLATRGFQDVHFTLSEISPQRAVFQNITVGKGQLLMLKNMTILYSQRADEISGDVEGLRFGQGELKANAAKALVRTKNKQGDWHLEGLQVQAGSIIPPVISGVGKLKYSSAMLFLSGRFESEDKAYVADFSIDYPFAHPADAQFKLVSAKIPWKGGILTTQNVLIPLGSRQSVKLTLQVRQVSTDALLQAMTGKRVSATGTVSGSLPLVIGRDGTVSFGAGELRADSAGILSLPPDAIPEGNEQVAMVRDILKNFHYKGLSVNVNSDKNNGISLLVALEGNNPDMYNGRPVKLNVRLAGDVLGYIRQNVLFLTSPETLLKQDQK